MKIYLYKYRQNVREGNKKKFNDILGGEVVEGGGKPSP